MGAEEGAAVGEEVEGAAVGATEGRVVGLVGATVGTVVGLGELKAAKVAASVTR